MADASLYKQEIEKLKKALEAEKLRYDNDLAKERNYYENIIALMPGHVYWLDRHNVFLGCNDLQAEHAKLTSRHEIVGKTNFDLPWKNEAEELNRVNNTVMDTGKPIVYEELATMSNGLRTYLSQKVPLRDKDSTIIGVLGISLDITELKETQEKLEEAKIAAEAGEKAKAEFIANVSHDMRTPLAGLIGVAHILEEDDVTEKERKALSAQLAEAGDSLLEMFEEILEDVAADHMTESDMTLETFDINHLVDRIAKLKKPSLIQKGLEFIANIDPNIPTYLISDRRKIHRIILNLMGNAIKFTKQGHIELKIELLDKQDNQITLKFNVIDTGIGVPEESKTRLFERFYKATPSYKTEYKGFGLGLHIAQSYTHLLNGTIGFESQEGVGSDFYTIISLKIANEEDIKIYKEKLAYKPSLVKIKTNLKPNPVAEKVIEHEAAPLTQTPHNAPRVLVIEDNLIIRQTTVRFLKKARLTIVDVDDGKPALDLAKTQHFDLILTDVGLLEMSGIEFTRQLRDFEKEHNKTPTPIVGVTAHATSSRDECLNAGMNAVVLKPLSTEICTEILKNFLPNYTSE